MQKLDYIQDLGGDMPVAAAVLPHSPEQYA